ncbi:MAG: T9SS type A sorting domain-containing protein [Bacteroidales bacterium]
MKRKFTQLISLIGMILGLSISLSAQNPCTGFKTFTIGGWGSECRGGNPGCVLDANFTAAFPNGLTIGCGSNTLTLTSVTAVRQALSATGTPGLLTPSYPATSSNTLAAQIIGVTLAVGIDSYNELFSINDRDLESLMIADGTFKDMTVSDFLQLANDILGGCNTDYSFSEVNFMADKINKNYDNGTVDLGYLKCYDKPELVLTVDAHVNCFGGNNGAASSTVTKGVPPFYYAWSNGSTTANIYGLTAGTYTLVVTDAVGQTVQGSITISQPPQLLASATKIDVSCSGGNNGSVTLSATGGIAPYAFSGDATSELVAGTYNYLVTDANGCTTPVSVTITQPDPLVLTANVKENVLCFEGSNGSVELSVAGGTPEYTFGGDAISGLAAGTYNYTVTDAHGCSATASATITQPELLVLNASVKANVSCFGGNDGAIELSAIGGTEPYTFTGLTENLTAGTYEFLVTDANGCTAIASATISQPDLLVLTATVKENVLCFGGSNGAVELSAVGGTPEYTFGGDATSGLTAGTYSYSVTDTHGCSATASATITQPELLVLTATVKANVSCFGGNDGTIKLSAVGGTEPYTFSGLTENLAAGTYEFLVTDAHGCTATASATISQPDLLVLTATVKENVLCFGGNNGAVELSAAGGTPEYTFGRDATSGLTAGTYSYSVTDTHGCAATASATITQPELLVLTASVKTNVSCFGGNNGEVELSAVGGAPEYTFGGDATSGLTAGTYSYSVTDTHGCAATASATITQPELLVLTATVKANVSCFGGNDGTIEISAVGGTEPYTFSGLTDNLTAGTYEFLVTDAHGCTATTSATISQPDLLVLTATVKENVLCFEGSNGAVELSAVGGTPEYIFGGDATSGLTAGTYNYSVTDTHGCSAMASATITQPELLVLTATVKANVSCFGGNDGAIELSAVGGTEPYTFSGLTENLTEGTYEFLVTDAHGCTAMASANISQPDLLVLTTTVKENVLCFGGSNGVIELSAVGGTPEYIYGGDETSGLVAGIYNYSVTDAHGCTAVATDTITQPELLILTATVLKNVSCFGGNNGAVELSATGGTPDYLFGGDAITELPAGTYNFSVVDAHGCSAFANATITQPEQLELSISKEDVYCFGGFGSATATVTGGVEPYSYDWIGTGQTSNQVIFPVGTYTLVVTDANGCQITEQVTLVLITCDSYVTVTQGGWGAKCNGNNWGCVLDSKFSTAFPTGIVVGSNGRYLKLTSANAVHNLLPTGGTPGILPVGTLTNPTSKSLKNTLVGQVVALTITIGIDNAYPDFAQAEQLLQNMIVTKGQFMGWTVAQLLEEGNKALGGISEYSAADLTNAIDAINKNFDNGTVDLGFLACPCVASHSENYSIANLPNTSEFSNFNENVVKPSDLEVYPNPTEGITTVKFYSNSTAVAKIEVYNLSGQMVKLIFNSSIESKHTYNVSFDSSELGKGIFILKMSAGADLQTRKIIVK